MAFPETRLRRWRASGGLRSLVRETTLQPGDLIQPLFVAETAELAGQIAAMPGIERLEPQALPGPCTRLAEAGVPAVMLFGLPADKNPEGSAASAPDGVVPQAIRRIKAAVPGLVVMADVCLCEYTDHGHCGILRDQRIDNDATLGALSRAAVAYAGAGADVVAPSAMMDGMVAGIRERLDAEGFADVAILSYAAKYASSFYGPFREAAQCAPRFGDRRTHQMDPGNAREALAEIRLDLAEGADGVMVKPAMPCLDVVSRARAAFPEAPLAAYQVSGEYAMIKAAAGHGWLDERSCVLESLTAIKRAGADMIITYFAAEVATRL